MTKETLNKVYAQLCMQLGDVNMRLHILQQTYNKDMSELSKRQYELQTQLEALNSLTPSITAAYDAQTPKDKPTPSNNV